MRLLKAGCASLVLVFSVGYGVIVSVPVARHMNTVEGAIVAAAKRHDQRKPQLKDSQANGFLNPKLGPFWGRGKDNAGPVHDAVSKWAMTFSDQGSGVKVDHVRLQKEKQPEYLAAREAFKALLGDLVTAFDKPVFQPVNEDFTAPTEAVNEQALTMVAMGLNGYAESLLAEGKAEQAALVYELVFREGQLVSQQVGIVQTMIGVTLQALAFQSLVGHLRPDAKLGPNQWAGLSLALAATTPTPDTIVQAMQSDLAFGTAFLNRPRASYDGDAKPLRGIYLLPGFRAREVRIYHNIMGSMLDQVKSGIVQQERPPDTRLAALKGQTSLGSQLLIPSYDLQSARLALHGAKMSGLAATTAICAYRAKYGKLPATLADLDALGLQAPGGAAWSAIKGLAYEVKAAQAVLVVTVHPQIFATAGVDVAEANRIEALNSSYFGLRPDGYLFTI